MGVAGGLRQAITGGALEDVANGRFEADAVPCGYIQRPNPGPGSQHRADAFFVPTERARQALLREGVIVRPVDNYGMPGYLRISIGLPQENRRCLDALARVLRK